MPIDGCELCEMRSYSLRAKRAAPRIPRKTSTTPASPRSNGMQRMGRSGIPNISAPTTASDEARTFEGQRAAAGSRRTQARTPQYTKTVPSAMKATGRVGNPTRPETASSIRSAPRSKTINSFKSWKSFADVNMRSFRHPAGCRDLKLRMYQVVVLDILPSHNRGVADME